MQTELQAQIAFYLTERSAGGKLDSVGELGLRPALMAGYRDLNKLRYDFPLVLVASGAAEPSVQSLSGLFDGLLAKTADGANAERLRKHALRIEQEIRTLSAQGTAGRLSALWDAAVGGLAAHNDELFQDSLRRLRGALKTDGEVLDCDKGMPFRVVHHVWKQLNDRKARGVSADIDRLITKLADILTADFGHSEAGLSAESLRAGIGSSQRDAFDFDAMSRLLGKALPKMPLPESRRQRIQWLLSVLRSQRFFASANRGASVDIGKTYDFVFQSCTEALDAYRQRLPAMIELAKAMAIAELEVSGTYNSAKHDDFFAAFAAAGLDPGDVARFPDYLISIGADDVPAAMKAFAVGLPAKVLVQTDDLLDPSPLGCEHIAVSLGTKQLAGAAIGQSTFFVLQSSSSNLLQMREQIVRGLAYPGPALFSVFSGAGASESGLPAYLSAAAAMESRAFPAFSYDPSAGPDLASRFTVHDNPASDLDWPQQNLAYENEDHQTNFRERLAFTFVDFVACDPRYARHFARVPRAKWNDSMAPVADFLNGKPNGNGEKVPYVVMVDRNDVLQKVLVDERLVREARQCAEMWHNLQELAEIHNSHAEKRVAQERKTWLEEQAKRDAELRASAPTASVAESAAAAPTAVTAGSAASEPAEAAPSPDEPYIETPRCATCNKYTQINDKMFAYDANKQASIINPDAGTYRQMVEAAEACQVAIIHPGKPRNPNEPDLEELLKRAEPFM